MADTTTPNDALATAVRKWLTDLDPHARADFLGDLADTDPTTEPAADAGHSNDDAYPANWKKN